MFLPIATGIQTSNLMLGVNTAVGTGANATGYVDMTRFQAVKTGIVRKIQTTPKNSGNFKFAIYSDNAGNPDALLAATGSVALTIGTPQKTTIANVNVVAGTWYWIAAMVSVSGGLYADLSSGTSKYKLLAFASAFPNPAGALTSGTYTMQYGGYDT